MKLIILDRDGVINYESADYIKTPEEWQPIPGSLAAIAQLTQAGYTIAIATNQSGIAKGLYDHAALALIHQKLLFEVKRMGGEIAAIFYCPHGSYDDCVCRKPKPGLLYQIAEYFQISLKDIPFIGDSFRDIEAARKVGCQPILVRTGYGEQTLAQYPELLSEILVYMNLAEASLSLTCMR
jgi:D-glycero-D-manno-heptose 1,7-bisphosphate phosphatase